MLQVFFLCKTQINTLQDSVMRGSREGTNELLADSCSFRKTVTTELQ